MRFVVAFTVSGVALYAAIRILVGSASDVPIADPAVAARGARVSNKCIACHALETRHHGVGPSLVGLLGRPAGSLAGYNYSVAMRESGVTWDKSSLKQFLMGPQEFIKGTNMGISPLTESEATELISYLENIQ
jgi:cytochrome c